jgi:hypothetical protein
MMRLRRRAARLARHADYGQIHLDEIDPADPGKVRVWTRVGRGRLIEASASRLESDGTPPIIEALRRLNGELESWNRKRKGQR